MQKQQQTIDQHTEHRVGKQKINTIQERARRRGAAIRKQIRKIAVKTDVQAGFDNYYNILDISLK